MARLLKTSDFPQAKPATNIGMTAAPVLNASAPKPVVPPLSPAKPVLANSPSAPLAGQFQTMLGKSAVLPPKPIETGAGLDDEKRNLIATCKRLETLLTSMNAELERHEAQIEATAVDIAMAAVAQIVGEAAHDRDAALAIVRNSLAKSRAGSITCLSLSPQDYAFVVEQNITLGDLRVLRVALDAQIKPGGCLIETATGIVDARVETQLKRLRDVVQQEISSAKVAHEPV
ncbi:FliH/SctL family protein [Andreprevotia chitinilytica]|uniref:FliH/SctL family protein n=1 Tax=Andreprevotia chitinilytica TaxID=396808 RepID=UPI000553C463|nr:FliH/SctL family protein [Andreprevotia chitinilytica]